MWFVHESYSLPGREGGVNFPTYLNGKKWNPKWEGKTSKPYRTLRPRLDPPFKGDVTLKIKEARGKVLISAQPTKDNDYTLSIRFDDPAGGAAAFLYL